mmetsp:Transcript_108894/g.314462  ORF Transcript_108894/g.314462 Transcript_108894/m.314462 type:complete len:217 (-) Transcript_108894:1220-1870(-)
MSASAAATLRTDKARDNARDRPWPDVDSGSAFSWIARAMISFVTSASECVFIARSSRGDKGRCKSGSLWPDLGVTQGSLKSKSFRLRASGLAPAFSKSWSKRTSGVRFRKIAARNSPRSSADAALDRAATARRRPSPSRTISSRCSRAAVWRHLRMEVSTQGGQSSSPHTSMASNSPQASTCKSAAQRKTGSSAISACVSLRPSCNLAHMWTCKSL